MAWYDTYFKYVVCGGAIHSENVIITAAHCCNTVFDYITENPDKSSLDDYEIIAGELNPSEKTQNGQRSKIQSYQIHPDYDENTMKNDICLLHLESKLDLGSNNVKNVKMPNDFTDEALENKNCYVTGWSTMDYDVKAGTDTLKYNQVITYPDLQCYDDYSDHYDSKRMFCAGRKVRL